jgi:transcriptional regulator with XRE-family HTH domain
MNRLSNLIKKLRNKDYRNIFMSARVAAAVGGQILALRQKRGWRQGDLAERAGMKQSRISLIEKADYENFSFNTLKRIAAAFDVAVIIQFVGFPEFMQWSQGLSSKNIAPEPFNEAAFWPPPTPSSQETMDKALQDLLQAVNNGSKANVVTADNPLSPRRALPRPQGSANILLQ